MKYQGSCHCGQIAFEVEGEFTQAIECNCSICSKKGALLWGVSPEHFRLLTPNAEIASYMFGKQSVKHQFCPRCGIHPFAEGIRSGAPMVVVNLRCLDGVDVASLPMKHFDGRSL